MTTKTVSEIVEAEISKLGKGKLLTGKLASSVEAMTFLDALQTYHVLNALSKSIKDRLDEIKPLLHEAAITFGRDGKTPKQVEVSLFGNTLIREKSEATAPDDEKLRALLETRKIPFAEVYDEVKALTLNPSKLQFLVETGRLSKDDVHALKNVSWKIKTEGSAELNAAFDKALGRQDKSKTTEKAVKTSKKR